MENNNKTVLLKGKRNSDVYVYNDKTDEGFKFTNLSTGNSGVLSAEKAKEMLVLPVTLNDIYLRNPNVLTLITTLKLSISDD